LRWGKPRYSLRAQLVVTFVLCTLVAVLGYDLTIPLANQITPSPVVDQSSGKKSIDLQLKLMVGWFEAVKAPTPQQIQNQIDLAAAADQVQVIITDVNGQALYTSGGVNATQIDLLATIHQATKEPTNSGSKFTPASPYVALAPITLNNHPAYIVLIGIPKTSSVEATTVQPTLLNLIVAGLLFLGLFWLLTRRTLRAIQTVAQGLGELAKGNLSFRLPEKRRDELGQLAAYTNQMAAQLQKFQEQERQQEQLRNDLITHVSHDLRTPLTSIMGYLQLVKDQAYQTEEERGHYVDIAYAKAAQLKKLIEALFEYTKLNNQGVELHLTPVSLNALLEQFIEEWRPLAEEQEVGICTHLPAEHIKVLIDTGQMVRVLENLMSNAIKYSLKPDTIQVATTQEPTGTVLTTVSNQAKGLASEELEHLFDRFYQAGAARSASAEGAGLGLAIAKSIVELHGGDMWAEQQGERLCFCIRLNSVTKF
jgi:signal transduction histidine kinase